MKALFDRSTSQKVRRTHFRLSVDRRLVEEYLKVVLKNYLPNNFIYFVSNNDYFN